MTYAANSKSSSTIEMMRKPVSFFFAGCALTAAFFTVPRGSESGWHEALELIGFLFLILAALGRIWAMAYIVGRKTRELCRQGPYSLMRNPLYFFSFVGVVGFGLAIQNLIWGAVVAVCYILFYNAIIHSEEQRLRAVHGEAFDDYCAHVPRFWPKLRSPTGDAEITLKVPAFTRGLREVFWFLAAIIGAEILELVHSAHLWPTITLPI